MAAYGEISLVKTQLQISATKLLISRITFFFISRIHILEMNKS